LEEPSNQIKRIHRPATLIHCYHLTTADSKIQDNNASKRVGIIV